MGQHDKDVPFALLYLVNADRKRAHLAGTAGVDGGKSQSPPVVELTADCRPEQIWPLGEVFTDGTMRIVEDLPQRLSNVPAGPWSDPPHSAVVLPIPSNIAHSFAGLLVLGISSRLRFDDTYRAFCELVSSQIAMTITNARAYEEERKRAEALAEIDRAKTTFFSNVSHEFRTPLTLMMSPLEDLLQNSHSNLEPDHRRQLTVVHRNSLRLLKLVNSLLDFSRIEAGRVEAVYEPTDIASLTAEVASTFRSAMDKARLIFEVDCEPLQEAAFVDHDMWEKIVMNLISNAFKFTFEGKVSVVVKSVANTVELQVSDTGTGIPEHELPHLFERFHRVEGARGRTYEGTGIGLALVQELARLHRGSVGVQSSEGVGSTFTVTIPKGKDHLPQDRIGAARRLASSAIRADSYVEEALRWLPTEVIDRETGLGDIKDDPTAVTVSALVDDTVRSVPELIVLADDNADMRDYLRHLVGGHYRVHAVSNGPDAVKAAEEFNPDLVLTDVMTPGMDGFGVLRALHANAATRAIPVILLSARAGEESRLEGLRQGADDYLVKPFTARELLARVAAHLKMARVRTEASERERRLRSEIELERDRLRESFGQAPSAMALLNGPDHKFVFANAEYLKLTDRSRSQIIGLPIHEVFPEVNGQGHFELLDRIYQRGERYSASESQVWLNRHGRHELIYVNFAYQPLRDINGQVEGILVHAVEVTEQVLARTQLETRVKDRTAQLEHAHEELRKLNYTLVQAQEEERRRLALELHDGAGQWLAALKWKMDALQEDIAPHSPELSKRASDCLTLLDELSKEVRTVSHLLHPPLLDEAGLFSALGGYVEGLEERSGLVVKLEFGPDRTRLPREVEMAVFRIVQEALTNIHRHAQAKTANVRINQNSEMIRVEIQDGGRGIPSFTSLNDPNVKMGVGLRGMYERVKQLGGNFELRSGTGGTTVTAVLPIGYSRSQDARAELAS
jgi:PAS domain S-box-containing protein